MFVGHAAIAFCISALIAYTILNDKKRALYIGLVGGAFAFVPDIDVVTGVVQVGLQLVTEQLSATETVSTFWEGTHNTHRGVTHSLFAAVVGSVIAYFAADRYYTFPVIATLLMLSSAIFISLYSPVGGVMIGLFGVFAGILAITSSKLVEEPRWVFFASLVAFVSHPFGDLFTGQPPAFLYPFSELPLERIALSVDPTVNLLLAGLTEVAALWVGVLVLAWLTEHRLRGRTLAYGVLGVLAVIVPFMLFPPTLEVSYHFVLPVIGLALLSSSTALLREDRHIFERTVQSGAVAVLSMSISFVAYLSAYLVANFTA